ncbi:MAG: hypothetical protein KUG78_01740 [Kangiellaceae bacterium]|nr:hypothetical protein [Kangiellaceae bacterium]
MTYETCKLNIGCGRDIIQGWKNLDQVALEAVDLVANLDRCETEPLPLEDNIVDEFLLSHVIEHISNPN